MKFRTEYIPSESRLQLDIDCPPVMLGSCFSDYIGSRMRSTLWDVSVNPCGTLFNPMSIAKAIRLAMLPEAERHALISESIRERNGIFCSMLFPSAMNAASKEECVANCMRASSELARRLSAGSPLIVTFGTARVYSLAGTGRIVANCHKFPAKEFDVRMVSADEIADDWLALAAQLKEAYGNPRIIFTVSPVRHIADGLAVNSLSKATLRVAIQKIVDAIDDADYFPSYEIVTDDLRDYRFYATDLVHPSDTAIEYIWEKFLPTYFDSQDIEILKQGESISKRLHHRHLTHGPAAEAFDQQTARLLKNFTAAHPAFHPARLPELTSGESKSE